MSSQLRSNLLRLMEAKGLNQARLCKLAGVPKATLHGYLNPTKDSQSKVDTQQVKKIAEALKTDFHELLFGFPDPHSRTRVPEEVLKEIFSGDLRVTIHKIEKKS